MAAADFGNAADTFRQALASAMDLNRSDLRIVMSLRPGEVMTAGAVAAAAGLSPAAATEAVARLVERGLLTRTRDATDRRRAAIAISSTASEQLELLTRPVRDAGRALFEGLTIDQLTMLTDFLRAGSDLQVDGAHRIRPTPPAPGP